MQDKQRTTKKLEKILCVDDETHVLEGLSLNLRKYFKVYVATSGPEGLEILRNHGPFAIVLSDMRMPNMDGAEFLKTVHQHAPSSVRILLTGYSDMDSAVRAINEGQIFRFLTKPCAVPNLLSAFKAALKQYHLITAEKVLLEQTLRGSISALADVLVLTNPKAFGRATRLKQSAKSLAQALKLPNAWQVDVAALLSQIGYITLPNELIEKAYYGQAVTSDEQQMLAKVPDVAQQVLNNIPRMEDVQEILHKSLAKPGRQHKGDNVSQAAEVLRIVTDFDKLEAQGNSIQMALDTMRGKKDYYPKEMLEKFAELKGSVEQLNEVREIGIKEVRVGMIFVEDVKLKSGSLLVPRGYEVTNQFVERARNFAPGFVEQPLKVKLEINASDENEKIA